MYKDKDKEREAAKERMRRYRKGVTGGVTTTEGVTVVEQKGVTDYPGIIDFLTDKKKRESLEKVVQAFKESHHPEYAADVYVGLDGPTVLMAGDLLDCTRDIPMPKESVSTVKPAAVMYNYSSDWK